MVTEINLKGPASYFPSIEKTYQKPISYWFDLVDQQSSLKHMQIVSWLKTEYSMGHGHANAIVAYRLTRHSTSTKSK